MQQRRLSTYNLLNDQFRSTKATTAMRNLSNHSKPTSFSIMISQVIATANKHFMKRALIVALCVSNSMLFAQQEIALAPKPLLWENIKSNIFPVMMSAVISSDTANSFSISHGNLIGTAYSDELQICYLIKSTRAYVNKKHIKEWGVTPDSIYQTALANITNTAKTNSEFSTNNSRTFCKFNLLNNEHDASLLLIANLWVPSARALMQTDDIRMFIPNQEKLYLVVANSAQGMKAMNEEIDRSGSRGKGHLSQYLFKYENNKWIKSERK